MAKSSSYVSLEKLQKSLNIDDKKVSKAKKRLETRTRSYQLAELRRSINLTQTELAERIGVGQTRVSAIELGELSTTEVGTVQAYIAALGGELELSAKFGNINLRLN